MHSPARQESSVSTALVHDALFYRDRATYVAGIEEFVGEAHGAGAPTLLAVPADKLPVLQEALGWAGDAVTYADMNTVGRNPGRIIPTVHEFLDVHRDSTRAYFVGEPIWPTRTEVETREAVWHEALLNLAFAESTLSVLCPYDAGNLTDSVLDAAYATHPCVLDDGDRHEGHEITEPAAVWAAGELPSLPPPPAEASTMEYRRDSLAGLRTFVAEFARRVGLHPGRVEDLALLVSEGATNSLVHADSRGTARIWADETEVVCQLTDPGWIRDPLVGRQLPSIEAASGRGIWLIHQLADLVELRSGPRGTTVRMHFSL